MRSASSKFNAGFRGIALPLCLVALTACDAAREEAAKAGAQLREAGKQYVVQPIKSGYEEKVKPAISDSVAHLEEVKQAGEEVKQAADTINKTVDDTKETVDETKTAVREKARAAKSTVYALVRKAPRSQQEANEMVEVKGRGYFEWLREKMNAFVERNQLRRTGSNRKEARS